MTHSALYLLPALMLFSLAATMATDRQESKSMNNAHRYAEEFRTFKSTFGRVYATAAEEERRYRAFVANMQQADILQAANPFATFGPASPFADIDDATFIATRLSSSFSVSDRGATATRMATVTNEERSAARAGQKIDWRTKGAVSPVQEQGECASGWAFAATGNMEAVAYLAGSPLGRLSEQELVSCDTMARACRGGLINNAFNWIINKRQASIVTAEAYPYVSGGGEEPPCKTKDLDKMPIGATITGHLDMPRNETDIAAWMFAHGPVAIAIDARAFKLYVSGIMTHCMNENALNHGVLAVGFDDTNDPPYWIIKNSWGTKWGEEGYIRVAKGSNLCLLSMYATTAVIGTIVQMNCVGLNCTKQCVNTTVPGVCLPSSDGMSMKMTCSEEFITIHKYKTKDCKGMDEKNDLPTKQCMIRKEENTSFVNLCTYKNARNFTLV